MTNIAPEITVHTTIWRMWLGFNASHSMGLLLFSLIYTYLALAHGEVLFQSYFLQGLGFAVLAADVLLAKLYRFMPVLAGASISLILYLSSVAMAWAA